MEWIINKILANIPGVSVIVSGIASVIYIYILKTKLKTTKKDNAELKEAVAVSRIVSDMLKKQQENKVKLDAQKEDLKSKLDNALGD